MRRDDRNACIGSLVKNSELFSTALPLLRQGSGRDSQAAWQLHSRRNVPGAVGRHLSIEEKLGWYYDKTMRSFPSTSICSTTMEVTTESLNDETTRRAIAEFIGGEGHKPPPKAHLNASVIDIASYPKEQQHKMHWLIGRLNIEELASDEAYGLDYFLEKKFVAWTGHQIVDSPGAQTGAAPAGKITADLERAAKVINDRLRDIDALHQLVRDQSRKDTER